MLNRVLADLLILIDLLFYYLITYFPGPTSDCLSTLNLFELENEMPGSVNLTYSFESLYEPGPGVYFVLLFVISYIN